MTANTIWEHGNVDDKMYDSRAGLGVFYRWQPRNMQRLCEQQKAAHRRHPST